MGLHTVMRRKRTEHGREAERPPRSVDLAWIDLGIADIDRHPEVLADIAHRRLDGVTVSGVFTADECARAVQGLEHHADERTPAMFGEMLGMSLANVAQHSGRPDDRTAYLDDAERVAGRFREAFGFEPFERACATMSALGGGIAVAAPQEGGRPYLPGNVRWMEPHGRALPAHVGNEFQLGNLAYSHLETVTRIRDHYSWFVVIQEPEAGGALSVYDLLFESHQPANTWGEHGRDDTEFDRLPARSVGPDVGTLVLFGGGWRWHRVEPIGGTRPRMTYGGFAGHSTDGAELHCWF